MAQQTIRGVRKPPTKKYKIFSQLARLQPMTNRGILFALCTCLIWFLVNNWNRLTRNEDEGVLTGSRHRDRYSSLTNKHVVVLGDSQMHQTTKTMAKLLGGCQQIRRGSRCGEAQQYLNLPEPTSVHLPSDDEGPIHYGLQNIASGCRDCGCCDALLYICRDQGAETTLEFIAMEFPRDVSLQSSLYRTTQENILHYLSKLDPSHLVVNVGLHSTALREPSVVSFANHLEWFFKMGRKELPGTSMFWLDTFPVVSWVQPAKWRDVTSDEVVTAYNHAARRVSKRLNIDCLSQDHLLRFPYFREQNRDGVHYFNTSDPAIVDRYCHRPDCCDTGDMYNMVAFDVLNSLLG